MPPLALLKPDDVANLVGTLAGRRLVEHVSYVEDSDVLTLQSGYFAALIERSFIDELKNVPRDQLKRVTVSAAGTTIELDELDIHIEAAGLLADYINHLRVTGAGGPLLELFQGRIAMG
jgi:uncharacterized protein DUF2442